MLSFIEFARAGKLHFPIITPARTEEQLGPSLRSTTWEERKQQLAMTVIGRWARGDIFLPREVIHEQVSKCRGNSAVAMCFAGLRC